MTDFYLELFDFHRYTILSVTERTLVFVASVMPIISYPTKVPGLLTVTRAVAEVGALPVRGIRSSKICNFPWIKPSATDLYWEPRLRHSSALVVGRHDANQRLLSATGIGLALGLTPQPIP